MTTETKTPQQNPVQNAIVVKATYTVKKEFVAQNQANIRTFMKDLEHHQGIRYLTFLNDDGQTFTHLALSSSTEAQKEFLALKSFARFQQERDENLVGKLKLETLTHVASSFQIF